MLFGPLYFVVRGIWSHAIASAILAPITFGLSWIVYPFFARWIVLRYYIRRGWEDISFG